MKTYRSLMFTPATRTADLNKIGTLGADIYIIDLEDAVPEYKKDRARETAKLLLSNKSSHRMGIRINSLNTLHGLKDLQMLTENDLDIELVIPSKVNQAHELRLMHDLFKDAGRSYCLFPLIETAESVKNVFDIAASVGQGGGLVFGSADLSAEIGIDISWDALLHARSQIMLAASMYQLKAIDTPFFNLNAPNHALIQESKQSKAMGFVGRLVIHPDQVSAVNQTYSLTEAVMNECKKIVSIAHKNKNNIAKGSNHIIGPPFIKLAARRLMSSDDQVEN